MFETFKEFIREYTGLTLYDFRVLDMDGSSEKEVRDIFRMWLEDYRPTKEKIADAIEAAAYEGFDVSVVA